MNPELIKSKLYVSLNSVIDLGRIEQISTNSQISEMKNNRNLIYYEVSNLYEASVICMKYIQVFNLGGGNWSGGRVVDETFNFIARISYNGRIWDSEDLFNSKEVVC